MPNNQINHGDAEDQKAETFLSLALLPEGISHKVANILMDSIWFNSEQVAESHGVSGGYVRNIITKHRGLYNDLVKHKNIVIKSRCERAQMKALELVSEGLASMDKPTTPSQAMALGQLASQLGAMRDKMQEDSTQKDTKKIIENGTKAALKLRNKANGK